VPFPIIDVSSNTVVSDEQLGSKNKFWIARDAERWLFKEARKDTGEDWAEKIASEVGRQIDVSAPRVELAEYAGRRGCLSLSFVGEDESLVHGNEILAGQIVGYERQKRLRQSDHTFDNIVSAVRKLVDEADWYPEVLKDLAHYLVFDALICNTDRHHENWGFLTRLEEIEPEKWMMHLRLAPSFDHASSRGRELRDDRRQALLVGNRIDDYVRRGRGGIYWKKTDDHGANPVQLVEVLARRFPDYFRPALESVAKNPINDLCASEFPLS
jgi:HipA-like C-terminal domain